MYIGFAHSFFVVTSIKRPIFQYFVLFFRNMKIWVKTFGELKVHKNLSLVCVFYMKNTERFWVVVYIL